MPWRFSLILFLITSNETSFSHLYVALTWQSSGVAHHCSVILNFRCSPVVHKLLEINSIKQKNNKPFFYFEQKKIAIKKICHFLGHQYKVAIYTGCQKRIYCPTSTAFLTIFEGSSRKTDARI